MFIVSLVFGMIWMWYLAYWKKDNNVFFILTWILLIIYPYLISTTSTWYIIWIVLTILPWFIRS